VSAAAKAIWRTGIEVAPGFLSGEECRTLLSSLARYRLTHHLPLVHRPEPGRALRYLVVDGDRFDAVLLRASNLVARVHSRLEEICGCSLALIDDPQAARNINITPPGGQYPWHYDRNLVTALVYLNTVEGGETELYPNSRTRVSGGCPVPLQHTLGPWPLTASVHNLVGAPITITPAAGTLVALHGNHTLHSVRPVDGNHERVNLVLAFDQPGASRSRRSLNTYLYPPIPSLEVDTAASVRDVSAP
jgi:2OG-Fe(II) oxygenase superfamily